MARAPLARERCTNFQWGGINQRATPRADGSETHTRQQTNVAVVKWGDARKSSVRQGPGRNQLDKSKTYNVADTEATAPLRNH